MWMLALTLTHTASAAPLGSPEWPADWGLLRVQTALVGEQKPTETQLKWRTGALRADLSLQEHLGIWIEGSHTGGKGSFSERIGGNAGGGGIRSSYWLGRSVGLGLQGRARYQDSWTLGSSGGIKARGRTLHIEGTPTLLVGDSSAHGWAGLSMGSVQTIDLLVAEPSASWTRPGYRGWHIGAEVRSSNLAGIGSTKPLRSYLGFELQWATERSCSVWSGFAF